MEVVPEFANALSLSLLNIKELNPESNIESVDYARYFKGESKLKLSFCEFVKSSEREEISEFYGEIADFVKKNNLINYIMRIVNKSSNGSFFVEIIVWKKPVFPYSMHGCITCTQKRGEFHRDESFISAFDINLRPIICIMPVKHIETMEELDSAEHFFKFAVMTYENTFDMIEISQGHFRQSKHLNMKLKYSDSAWLEYKTTFCNLWNNTLKTLVDFQDNIPCRFYSKEGYCNNGISCNYYHDRPMKTETNARDLRRYSFGTKQAIPLSNSIGTRKPYIPTLVIRSNSMK